MEKKYFSYLIALMISLSLFSPIGARAEIILKILAPLGLIANLLDCKSDIYWGCDVTPSSAATVTAPTSLSVDQTSASTYCGITSPEPLLSWNSGSVQQSAYQIHISTVSDFSTKVTDTQKVTSTSQSYQIPSGLLSYNTTYYWRVRIWDQSDAVSDFAKSQFTSVPHQGPSVSFTWAPPKPVRGATITFTNASTLFGGASASAFDWTFPPNTTVITAPATDPSEQVKFNSLAPKNNTVRLSVTDSDNLTCNASKDITLTSSVFDVKEVK